MNSVQLIGRLTREPELRYVPGSGMAVTKFGIAIDKGLSKDKKQEAEAKGQPTADFVNIVIWGKMAESAANHLAKGRLVGINGRIQTGSYDKAGTRIYTTDVVATQVHFLEWGDKGGSNNNTNWGNETEGFMPVANSDDMPF